MAVRRQLTVVFSDLAGYTELSERVDPETLATIQTIYQTVVREAVERFGGYVASFSGDGALAYFGYPTAHENDAERAVRASLDIVARVPSAMARAAAGTGWPPAVRVGLHTGLVVLGPELLTGERIGQGAAGMAVNLAARLQALAGPNCVVASAATAALVEGLFHTEALGSWPIRGLSRPVDVHRIHAARHRSGRAEARMVRGASRMINREAPLATLLAAWQVASAGQCRVVEVVAEAGIGKTRLAQELSRRLDLAPSQVIQTHCVEIFAATPLYPAAGVMWAAIGLDGQPGDHARQEQVSAFLQDRGLAGAEQMAAACALLGLVQQDDTIAPGDMRRCQFDLVIALVERIARAGPALLWLEDAHWIDASSAELMVRLVKQLASLPLLVLMTRRALPEQPGLPRAHTRVELNQLEPAEALELARVVRGAAVLPAATLDKAVVVAEGVPLFIEQLVISLLGQHSDQPGTAAIHVPLSLTEIMSARLDRLQGARWVAHTAACVGRAFDAAFLAALLESPAAEVQGHLEQLVQAEILRPVGDGRAKHYIFSHALLHRVAYESMLLADRRRSHARIAVLLRSEAGPGIQPAEVLAHHLSHAGDTAPAITAWLEAGTQAARRSAHLEALEHFASGLRLLDQLDDKAGRDAFELQLQAGRLAPLSATSGATSEAMDMCCRRGLELALAQGATPLVYVFLYGECTVMHWRGNQQEALNLARLFAKLAERQDYALGRAVAHRLIGLALLSSGETAQARMEVERSLGFCAPEQGAQGRLLFGQDAHVQSLAALGLILFCLGDVGRAFEFGRTAIAEADELRHPHSTAIAIGYYTWTLGFSEASELLQEQAQRLIQISVRYHLGLFQHMGEAALGWALSQGGELDQGIALLEEAIARLEQAAFRNPLSGFLVILADAHRRRGNVDRARAMRARADEVGVNQWVRPEIERVAALLLPDAQMADGLRAAAALAREMGLPVMELRCLRSLCEITPAADQAEVAGQIAALLQSNPVPAWVPQPAGMVEPAALVPLA